MIAVVLLALLMVPVFFLSVQRVLARDRQGMEQPAKEERSELAEPQRS